MRARPLWYPQWPEYEDELHFAAEERTDGEP